MEQHGWGKIQVEMATLEEALTWNKTAIKDYKYDVRLDGRAVPCGLIWGGESPYTTTAFPNFSRNLLDFASERISAVC